MNTPSAASCPASPVTCRLADKPNRRPAAIDPLHEPACRRASLRPVFWPPSCMLAPPSRMSVRLSGMLQRLSRMFLSLQRRERLGNIPERAGNMRERAGDIVLEALNIVCEALNLLCEALNVVREDLNIRRRGFDLRRRPWNRGWTPFDLCILTIPPRIGRQNGAPVFDPARFPSDFSSRRAGNRRPGGGSVGQVSSCPP